MDLAEFLLARIAEDEELAREADRVYVHPGANDPMFGARKDDEVASRYWDRIADPARVLAECEAKRRIVALADWTGTKDSLRERLLGPAADFAFQQGIRKAMEMLALPYASHQDYRQEWAPTTVAV